MVNATSRTRLLLTEFADAPLQWRVTNDPVMGGGSSSTFLIADGVGTFQGTCRIVTFLNAPGFAKVTARDSSFPDAAASGALYLTVRSSTPTYAGFRVDWSSAAPMPSAQGWRHGERSFKAGFTLPEEAARGFVTVRVPWSSFSVDWSEYTGECNTVDPIVGTHHHCCSATHPDVCPTAAHLRAINGIGLWAEGVEGDFELVVQNISAGP